MTQGRASDRHDQDVRPSRGFDQQDYVAVAGTLLQVQTAPRPFAADHRAAYSWKNNASAITVFLNSSRRTRSFGA